MAVTLDPESVFFVGRLRPLVDEVLPEVRRRLDKSLTTAPEVKAPTQVLGLSVARGAVYACLRIGAIVVVADAGLGVAGLTRAVRGAHPDVIIGESLGLAVARVKRWPGVRISTARLTTPAAKALGVSVGTVQGVVTSQEVTE